MVGYSAPLRLWRDWLADSAGEGMRSQLSRLYSEGELEGWRHQYDQALAAYAAAYGEDAEVVIARCPAQMNVMGMHIDYGGMPSLRLAVKGADTITVAGRSPAAAGTKRVRMTISMGSTLSWVTCCPPLTSATDRR
jgi:hypothetical protein